MNANWSRNNIFVYLLILVAAAALFLSVFQSSDARPEEVDVTSIARAIQEGSVESIVVNGDDVEVTMRDGDIVRTRKDEDISFLETLESLGVSATDIESVEITVDSPGQAGNWLTLLTSIGPLLFVGALLFLLMRQAQGSNSQAMSFGKSKAKVQAADKPTVTFDDVAGCDEAKVELAEVVEFLKEPEKFASLGARIPKGVLMVGHPGTGKTLMAKAVAGEAGVPFFTISGSEFVEMFVGVGASRVRDLFEQAKRNSPCIVFIDEIDAVGRHRGAGLGGSHDEREQTLNQILVEMDGFDTDTNVIIIAATNRPDILDPALLRPGRFDRRVVLDKPDVRGRRAIFDIHVKGKPLANDIDLDILARATPGFAGADIENVVNEAAILAARRNKRTIGMSEFEEAVERVALGGPERRSRVLSENRKRLTAYHEAGHAVVAKMLDSENTLQKVTIIPRGQAAGYAWQVPEEEKTLYSKEDFMARIAVALGGRIAEEIVFGDISSGASSDLEQVTRIARDMVTRYGMSEKLGPMVFGRKEEMVFLGREISEQRNYSEEVAEEIDREVRKIVDEGYEMARAALEDRRDLLDLVAQALLDQETLTRDELKSLFDTGALPSDVPKTPSSFSRPAQQSKPARRPDSAPQQGPATPPSPAPA
ncbi:MAG TPA: ATP-dependent zinc metalloprotease FtsH [Caldilineae bacterium]|nr:ATP-dependent zinc metalloprotease FtsH [Caldilineae bacterium]